MRLIAGALLLLVLCSGAKAQAAGQQSLSIAPLQKGTWDFGPEVGGGPSTGLLATSTAQFLYAGGRVGRILSGTHLSGWRRGKFEWAADVLPFYKVYTSQGAVYGGSFRPIIWQWDFDAGSRVAPYIAASGGVLFTTRNIPPGNTSPVNFTPEGTVGARIFTSRRNAVRVEGSVLHVSNANLGVRNPGYPVSVVFTVGYSWFKRPK